MKYLFFFMVFICVHLSLYSQVVSPSQGDVVINTFDSKWDSARRAELIVLVNRSNKTINLNGYELQSFGVAGEMEKYGYYLFSALDIIVPNSFLLVSSYTGTINGVSRDRIWVELPSDDWTDEGYLALRKTNPISPDDYLDIVKHRISNPIFTGVPVNSGLNISSPPVVFTNEQVATRGGVSGDSTSLNYSGYMNYFNDFSSQDETTAQIQNSGSTLLPVELSFFSSIVLNDKIKLSWTTITETNNYGFEIERENTQNQFQKIGFVTGNGNSNSPKQYSFIDDTIIEGSTFKYRLKQVDNDGTFEYSKVLEVKIVPDKLALEQNYPNPFNPTTTIKFSIPEAGYVKLTLYNILAQEIKTLVNESKEAGVHTVNFNASDLNSGLYIYKLEANGLTQTRKMTLVK
jgi:hypothetical protein